MAVAHAFTLAFTAGVTVLLEGCGSGKEEKPPDPKKENFWRLECSSDCFIEVVCEESGTVVNEGQGCKNRPYINQFRSYEGKDCEALTVTKGKMSAELKRKECQHIQGDDDEETEDERHDIDCGGTCVAVFICSDTGSYVSTQGCQSDISGRSLGGSRNDCLRRVTEYEEDEAKRSHMCRPFQEAIDNVKAGRELAGVVGKNPTKRADIKCSDACEIHVGCTNLGMTVNSEGCPNAMDRMHKLGYDECLQRVDDYLSDAGKRNEMCKDYLVVPSEAWHIELDCGGGCNLAASCETSSHGSSLAFVPTGCGEDSSITSKPMVLQVCRDQISLYRRFQNERMQACQEFKRVAGGPVLPVARPRLRTPPTRTLDATQ